MNELIPYMWLGIIIFAVVVEFMTLSLVSVWFMPAGLAAFILSLFNAPVRIQTMLFSIISLILLILSKTIFKNVLKFRTEATNINALIGKTAMVTEEINNINNEGAVKINGLVWSAKTLDDDVIYEQGQVVYVVKIEGVKLICTR